MEQRVSRSPTRRLFDYAKDLLAEPQPDALAPPRAPLNIVLKRWNTPAPVARNHKTLARSNKTQTPRSR